MNYAEYTNASLTMMYEAVRGALAADDGIARQGGEPKFKVRETPDWKKQAADLEVEMLRPRDGLRSHRLGRRPGEAAVRMNVAAARPAAQTRPWGWRRSTST